MTVTMSPIANACPRSVATFAGRVVSIEVQPNNAAPSLIARISDGTGVVEAVFLGRRDIPGVVPGARMSVTGRLGTTVQMFNPRFELG